MELRRHYFVLPSQKVNILKSQLFLDLQNGGGHRQTTVLKTGEADRQAQGVMAYQNRYSETTSETSAGEKTTAAIEFLEVLCMQL